MLNIIPHTIYSDKIYYTDTFHKDIKSYFPNIENTEITLLLETGTIERFPASIDEFKFIPDIPLKKEISDSIKKLNFNVAAECLFFIPYKKDKTASKRNALLDSFKIATNIEKLKGIKYYSVSHKGEKVLFEQVEIISGRIPIPYPETAVPVFHSITAKIQDSTFGNNKYKIEYCSLSDFLLMEMTNIDRLYLAFIPVVGKESLLFYIIIIPGEEGFFLYSAGVTKSLDSDYIKSRVTQSVYNRVIALYNWFKETYSSL